MGLGIAPEHFNRWLALWEETLREQLEPPEAEALLTLARRMRPNLERFTHPSRENTSPEDYP
ncbi:hypothetical protein [Deinococcus alpinitundrae]|uniref:hypothetical protein n=1 Tax=Deinococcus alpinitundrae TaxID=468913 RepID=UPI001ED97A65|nr:hypothetical protein [Deinococcus alpinitundrae]